MSENIGSLSSALGYKAEAPLRPEIERTDEELDVSTSWIRFDGIRRRRVTAVLVEPLGAGPFAGLVFVHPFTADKLFFLAEAKQLAASGIVSLLIEAPDKRPDPHRFTMDIHDPKSVRSYYLQAIGDVRRGYDLLHQLDTIHSGHFGYVGREEGADLAVAVSVLEPRLTAAVCIASIPRRSLYWSHARSAEAARLRDQLGRMGLKRYTRALEEFDAGPLIRHAHAESWLFQFSKSHPRVAEEEVQMLRRESAGTMEVQFSDDELPDEAAALDRRRWLETNLLPRRT